MDIQWNFGGRASQPQAPASWHAPSERYTREFQIDRAWGFKIGPFWLGAISTSTHLHKHTDVNGATIEGRVRHYPQQRVTVIPTDEYHALEDERRFWRESAAATINEILYRARNVQHRLSLTGAKVPRSVMADQVRMWLELLDHSERRSFPPLCDNCLKAIRPGDVLFPYTDVTMHADCDEPRGGKHWAGEVIACEHVVVEDGEGDEHTGPGHVTLYAASPVFTDDQISQILADARVFCGAIEPRRAGADETGVA